MKIFPALVMLTLFSSVAFSQEVSREQRFRQIKELSAQIEKAVEDLLLPSQSDIKEAESQGVKIFRLMPREIYDSYVQRPQGGGAYYSFSTGSHDYQKTAQIELSQSFLSVGFAGLDYGLIADLGNIPLATVSKETGEIGFLVNYVPPTLIPDIRNEQRKTHKYETDTATFTRRVQANIGHAYAVRAITYDRADILVVLKIVRKDNDGSLIINWKTIQVFEKPVYDRNSKEPE